MPTFLLLPGLHGTAELFSRLVPQLPGGWSVRTVAYPADQALSLEELTELAVENAPRDEPYVIIAESFSGTIGLRVAARSPTGLTALVLVASFVTPPVGPISRWLLRVGAGLAARMPLSPNVITAFLLREDADEASVTEIQDAVRSLRPHVLASRLRILATLDARSDLEACTIPILYLAASQDRLVPRDRVHQVTTLCPQVVLRTLPTPHLVLQTEPRLAAQEIADFLALATPGA